MSLRKEERNPQMKKLLKLSVTKKRYWQNKARLIIQSTTNNLRAKWKMLRKRLLLQVEEENGA
jgi:hypothetical protein